MYVRIRDLRQKRNYSQGKIAHYLSCSQSSYSRIESGARELPVDILIKLAELYNVNVDYILGLTEFPYSQMKSRGFYRNHGF